MDDFKKRQDGSALSSSSGHGSTTGSDAESDIDESILKVFDMPTVQEHALAPPLPSEQTSIEGWVGCDANSAWAEKGESVSDLPFLDDFNARDLLAEWGI